MGLPVQARRYVVVRPLADCRWRCPGRSTVTVDQLQRQTRTNGKEAVQCTSSPAVGGVVSAALSYLPVPCAMQA